MRRLRFLALAALVVFAVTSASAQSDMAAQLGILIDTHVEMQGFPTTGSQIQEARQAVAENINSEINQVVEQIGELDGGSVVGHDWLVEVEAEANAHTPTTAAEQFVSYSDRTQIETVSGNDSRPPLPQMPLEGEIDGDIQNLTSRITDAVRDIFRSDDGSALPVYQPSDTARPQTQLEMLMERYGKAIAEQQGTLAMAEADRRRLAEAVADGAGDAIDQSNLEHKSIVKRVIRRYIQLEVAAQNLPINGYWRAESFEVHTNGQCVATYGDNDGPPVFGMDETDPGTPLCGYENNGLPYLTWQGQVQPYLPGTSSLYSREPMVDYQMSYDSSGASNGSVRTYTTVEYEVVAPDRIIVHYRMQESGGCSMSADYALELVTADDSVCAAPDTPYTPEPPPTLPPPVETGPYRVGQPIFNDEEQCNERNSPPDFGDEITLQAQPNGSLIVDYGTGTQTVYKLGDGYYESDTGMAAAARVTFTVFLYDDGSGGTMSWSGNSKDGNLCYVSRDLTLPGHEADSPDAISTPVPGDTGMSGDSGSDSGIPQSAALTPGEYTVTWSPFPGLDCPAALEPLLPYFDTATITAAGGGYTLDADLQYALTETSGQYTAITFNDDNTGYVVAVSSFGSAGHLTGSYTYFAADGTACLNQLDFAPVMP